MFAIRDFVWSPTDHLIAYWVPELQDIPSKIFITKIPSRDEVATKSRHLVSDVSKINEEKSWLLFLGFTLHLCVVVDHSANFTGTSRGTSCVHRWTFS